MYEEEDLSIGNSGDINMKHSRAQADLLRPPPGEFSASRLSGAAIRRERRTLAQMKGLFSDEQAFSAMDPDTELYCVDRFMPVESGTEGGLFFGITHLHPGLVGNEYFMTRGHSHSKANRGEYYWCISGEGFLLLKSQNGDSRAEKVFPGSLHYIPGFTAHRLVNSADVSLDVGACWPADAGCEYDNIKTEGLGLRILKGADGPLLSGA